jgi:hypothetical protein
MLRQRPAWSRGLRLYERDTDPLDGDDTGGNAGGAGVRARSRFRSLADPDRFALYSVRDAIPGSLASAPLDDHTLVVVREFRRVPLDASALALTVFTARAGQAAPLIAALAHWAELAVSLYQPAYLLLAHSLEQPRLSALLTGVHESLALQSARPSAFSLDSVLPELRPWLLIEPEWYVYCPDEAPAEHAHTVSPSAV